MQNSFYLDACRIGEIMGMNMEEWPKKTKIKVLLSAAAVFVAIILLSLI
jgi:hypothetical protein